MSLEVGGLTHLVCVHSSSSSSASCCCRSAEALQDDKGVRLRPQLVFGRSLARWCTVFLSPPSGGIATSYWVLIWRI